MRVRAVVSGAALALTMTGVGVLGAGAASAADDPYTSTPTVPTVESLADPTTTVPTVAGEVVTPAGDNEPSGTLPVTGGDVAGMLLIAAVAVGGGTILVTASRRREAGARVDQHDDHTD